MPEVYDDLYQRYLSVCQELADTREALADERQRRIAFESLLSQIDEMIRNQQRMP